MLDVLKSYLEYLDTQKHYSHNTIESYRIDIEKFLNFVDFAY